MAAACVIFCRQKFPSVLESHLIFCNNPNWGGLKKYRYMFMHVTESLWYIPETNTF